MARPLYGQGQPEAKLILGGHVGLWYNRFFDGYPSHWNPKTDQKTKEAWAKAKSDWITGVTGKVGDPTSCEVAAKRIADLCAVLHGQTSTYTTSWHFATGLGYPHPVENGFLWHPTLGTPYIQGSAVKGLVRSWVESWADFPDRQKRLATLYSWFGSEDKDPMATSQGKDLDTKAGNFIFFDALPVRPVILKADIMTPHMGKWYEQGDEITDINDIKQSDLIPADWHDPVPVVFLVADKPKFQFAIAPRTAAATTELPKVMEALGNALEWLGAGAKTAAGYGVMNREAHTLFSTDEKIEDVWNGVQLRYTPNDGIISTQGTKRASSRREDKDKLLAGLSLSNAAKERLRKGNFNADVTVKRSGNGWQIISIQPI